MATRWCADLRILGHPPCDLWDLPAGVADDVRVIMDVLNSEKK